jgi:transposase
MRHTPRRPAPAALGADLIVGLDLALAEYQAVVLAPTGERLTRFRVPHTRAGIAELLRRTTPRAFGREGGRVFAFEATGHVWEALAHWLAAAGERYVLVNPLATFRVREARTLDRCKTDLTDAEQIAELARTGLVTRTQLDPAPYVELRRAWGEYARLRDARARLKTLLSHQLAGFFPEFLTNWTDVFAPGALAVLRTGLSPAAIAALSVPDFLTRVRAHQQGRRLWRHKVEQVHERAQVTVACPAGMASLGREVLRLVERADALTAQMAAVQQEVETQLAALDEARHLRTIPGLGWVSVAGLLAHIGNIGKYRHGRQLIKLAGTNPSRRDSGLAVGRGQTMTRRGRAGLRTVVYCATVACLQHNPRLRAHYDRLVQRADRPLAKMSAIGACMNKLLLYAFAVMKRGRAFDPAHRWTPGGAARPGVSLAA